MKGRFIVLEGGEGSGKTTQARLLAEYLENQGYPVLLTKEPGGDDTICKRIRELLLDPRYKESFSWRAEFLLFEADRAQHVDRVIIPALGEGAIVVCDRYDAATFAYQCVARNACAPEEFDSINTFATRGLAPDFYFYIDIDPKAGLKRKAEEDVATRFEHEKLEFHERVRRGYLEFFEQQIDWECWQKLDGTLSIETLHQQIIEALATRQLLT